MVIQNEVEFALSLKQEHAYDILTLPEHSEVSEIVFGGGARGGKTFLGSFWIISSCMAMPQSAWLIAREELKTLKRTTQRTFFKVMQALGLRKDQHYNYNAQEMILTLMNGSIVFFSELKRIPSDPEFDRIGSYDLTGSWVDEAQEIVKDAKDALQFRFTVLKGPGWSTTPKSLYTCNPKRNWIYSDFWRPLIKEKKTIEGRAFITSLYTDNPYIDHERYKKNVLKTKNTVKIERLLYGNFEYDDDPMKLFEYEAILDLFTTKAEESSEFCITCDAARKGKDRAVIMLWRGLQIVKVWVIPKCPVTGFGHPIMSLEERLFNVSTKYGVRRSRVVVDEDGLGGGIVDSFKGCRGFINGSSPIQPRESYRDESLRVNYQNLKTQCYFEFARHAENGTIGITGGAMTVEAKEQLIEELEQVKQKDADKDGKIKLIGKDEIKEMLGRSPDLADAVMMRFVFTLNKIVIPDVHLA